MPHAWAAAAPGCPAVPAAGRVTADFALLFVAHFSSLFVALGPTPLGFLGLRVRAQPRHLALSPRGLAELHSLGFCVAPCGAAGCPAHASCVASRQIFARCATQPRRRGPLTTSPKGARCCRAAGSKRPAFLFLLWLDLTVWLSRTHCIETTTHSNQSKRYIKTSKPVSQTAPFGDLHHAPRLYGDLHARGARKQGRQGRQGNREARRTEAARSSDCSRPHLKAPH